MTHPATHPTDEDLILHFYGEAASDDGAHLDDHLRACPDCRAAWTSLTNTMALVDQAEVPNPGPAFERVMWARVQRDLPPAARGRWRTALAVSAWAAGVVLVTALVVMHDTRRTAPRASVSAAASGHPVGRQVANTSPARDDGATRARERVLLTALNDHFSQTEVLLTELLNSPDHGGQEMQFEQSTASDLVWSGRLLRETARQDGDVRLTQMLDELEGVLVEVARNPAAATGKDFTSLRSRIDNDALLFKVRAVTSDIQDRRHTLMTTSE